MKLLKRSLLILLLIPILGAGGLSILLANPQLVYAQKTMMGQVAIFHNVPLEEEASEVVRAAINQIAQSNLYQPDIQIELCLNENSSYPDLHPFSRGTAYSFWNKAVIYRCQPDFPSHTATFQWPENQYELRTFDLQWLIAHEFMHVLQYNWMPLLAMREPFWKVEGHAEYISRGFKNDGELRRKVSRLLSEKDMPHVGIPVFPLENGTLQNLSYFKYALMFQYLIEVDSLTLEEVFNDLRSEGEVYHAMISWFREY